MAYETLVVAFDRADRATEAVRAVRRLGVPSGDIRRHPVDAGSVEDVAALPEAGGATGLWAWLFGDSALDRRVALLRAALDKGGTVISVRVLADEADHVRAEIDRYGPLDLDAA